MSGQGCSRLEEVGPEPQRLALSPPPPSFSLPRGSGPIVPPHRGPGSLRSVHGAWMSFCPAPFAPLFFLNPQLLAC